MVDEAGKNPKQVKTEEWEEDEDYPSHQIRLMLKKKKPMKHQKSR